MDLIASPCRDLCDWQATQTSYDGKPLIACNGCGSQWVRGEPWSPRQADGSCPPVVQEQLRLSQPWLSFGNGGS